MNEGDVFNTEALKLSIRRINQLGYFKPMEGAPDLRPSAKGDDKLDVTFKVEEQNRNQFTFGGGVSGLEGTFVNASFSTTNFLGAGETFQLSAQTGRRTKNYQLAITEPYLFDRPITAGFDVFKRKITYDTLRQRGGLHPGRQGDQPHHRHPRRVASRGSSPTTRTRSSRSRGSLSPAGRGRPPLPDSGPVYNPLLFGGVNDRTESTLHPQLRLQHRRQPVHSPERDEADGDDGSGGRSPRGDVSTTSGRAGRASSTSRVGKKTALGVRLEGAYITPYGDTLVLPVYQRYFLGGETQIRGYNIRTIGPVDQMGRALGGNKYVLVQRRVLLRHLRPPAVPPLLRRGPGLPRRPEASNSGSSGSRRARSCASSCPCSTCPSA